MAQHQNPFSGLQPLTPSGLERQRTQDLLTLQPNANFWVREAGLSGIRARRALADQGIPMSREDERAISTQEIMAGAQQRLAELVESGDLDPMDAQEQAIQETMQAFMNAGDYEAAQGLLPGLNQIRVYKDEQSKIRSETTKNLASAQQSLQAGELSGARAKNVEARTPAQIARDEAAAEQALATARLRDRTDPNLRRGPYGPSGGHLKSTVDKVQQQILAGATAINRIGQISDLVLSNPGISSNAAGTIGTLIDQVKGTADLVRNSAESRIKVLNEGTERRLASSLEGGYNAFKRKNLNVALGEYKSLIVDLAYSLARARDTGGRLSDADIENAKEIAGAAGDPDRMVAVLSRLADNTYGDLDRMRTTYKGADFEAPYAEADEEYQRFQEMIELFKTTKGAKLATGGPVGELARPADIEEILKRHQQ